MLLLSKSSPPPRPLLAALMSSQVPMKDLPKEEMIPAVREVQELQDKHRREAWAHVKEQEKMWEVWNSPERDHVNFPRPQRPIHRPPTRLGFLPETWFTFFHEKTGVTGEEMDLF